jgi:hypothetical protein
MGRGVSGDQGVWFYGGGEAVMGMSLEESIVLMSLRDAFISEDARALKRHAELGARAIDMICDVESDRTEPCPVCGRCDFTNYTHADGCEWAAILEEATAP